MPPVDYIPRSGEQVYPPPYSAAGVQLYGFAVRADLATLQTNICDRYLNAPLGGGQRFKPASEHVMFVFNTIDQLRSMTPPFDQRGWFPEQEAAVWMVVADVERERLFWYHPYMLVDNSYALAMGREIYGFPKEFGWFQIPRGPDAPELLSVDTLAVKTFGADTPGLRAPLFTVRRGAAGGEPTVFGELKDLFGSVARIAGLEPGFFQALGLAGHMLDDLLAMRLPMAFLKQFRDGAAPLTACYQAIQEVDSRLVKFHGAKLFSDRYHVEIEDLDSHPIRQDLGLPAGPIDVEAAFWTNFDFEIGSATEVWRGGAGLAPLPPEGVGPPPVPPEGPGRAPGPGVGAAPATAATPPGPKKRIAILGGGAAAMATAWRLTSEPGWQERYEITLYQMGWRLGGKGASGRRPPHGRIEEHGLHIWLGFYHNSFRALQEVHREINPGVDESVGAGHSPPRIVNGVFARCEDAFQPHSFVGIDMDLSDGWDPWMMRTPISDDKPWQRDAMPSVAEYLQYLGEFLAGKAFAADSRPMYEREADEEPHGLLAWVAAQAKRLMMTVEEGLWSAGFAIATALGAQIKDVSAGGDASALDNLVRRLQGWVAQVFERQTANDLAARRHLFMLDMGATVLRGLVADRAFERARFNTLDEEFCGWLKRHGAMPVTASLVTNPLLRGLYDFVFAFDGGSTKDLDRTANFATAPALRTIMRMCFTYDGAIFWKMRAGMGDTIFTPFYKALARRGVQFKFFHRVQALRLDDAGQQVERIEIARQVNTTGPNRTEYQPLVNWLGLDCWPAEPDYAQIEGGEQLRAEAERQNVDLESMWFQWTDAEALTLQRGKDFDDVVFAISLGSVPFVAADLVAASPRWRSMVEQVKTVRTMGLQLWLKPDLRGLGWLGDSPVIDAYMEPFDTWADMSHLLPREDWSGAEAPPRNVAYFCGAMAGSGADPNDHGLPAAADAEVNQLVDHRVLARLGTLWPGAARADGSLDPALIVERFERANIDPSELYVMSAAGTSRFRIKANETGFGNLTIAGDWIDNGFNAGCVEAAVMSGLQAANAVLGRADLNEGVLGRELN